MIWSWWGSISNNRATGVKWVLAASIPLIASIWYTVAFDPAAAHELARSHGWLAQDITYSDSLGSPGTPEETYDGTVRSNVETIVTALTIASESSEEATDAQIRR